MLADFGIARRVDDSSSLTQTNITVGTVAYAAPEQLMGLELDGRADQYSLAPQLLSFDRDAPVPGPQSRRRDQSACFRAAARDRGPQSQTLGPWPGAFQSAGKSPGDRYDTCTDFAYAYISMSCATNLVPTTYRWPRGRQRVTLSQNGARSRKRPRPNPGYTDVVRGEVGRNAEMPCRSEEWDFSTITFGHDEGHLVDVTLSYSTRRVVPLDDPNLVSWRRAGSLMIALAQQCDLPALADVHAEVHVGQRRQVTLLGQGDHRDQPGAGHQVRVVEDCRRDASSMKELHLRDALRRGRM